MSNASLRQYPRARRRPDVLTHIPEEDIINPPKRRSRVGRFLRRTLALFLVVLLAGGGWLGWELYQHAAAFGNGGSVLPAALAQTDGRTNILLAGYSKDDVGHNGAELTDSIMVLSLDSAHKKADIISVPRDLYVAIPNHGYAKINAAYQYGEADNFDESGYAQGGMGLLEKVVSQKLGIGLNYYALIDYTAFRDTVNAVGGVNYTVSSKDSRGLYDPYTNLKLPNGPTQLNGAQALALARSRGDGPGSYGLPMGDFDRTEHQRQLLVALKEKASSLSVLANRVKVGKLIDSVNANVQTDMGFGQLETLLLTVRGMPTNDIVSHSLNDYDGQNLLTSYQTYDGQSALVPAAGPTDFSVIQRRIDQTLAASKTADSATN